MPKRLLPILLPGLILLGLILAAGCDTLAVPTPTASQRAPAPAGAPSSSGTPHAAPGELLSHGAVGDPDQPIPAAGVPTATVQQGAQPLASRQEGDTRVFELTAQPVRWPILPGVTVTAWSYNGMVPGPTIHLVEGDKVRIILHNRLPVPTTIHWHGLIVPNAMDGVPDMTQPPVPPGGDFTYEFTVHQFGTYWYHSHFHSDVQLPVGLYGPLIIDPRESQEPPADVDQVIMLSEWKWLEGDTYPAMPMAGMEPNYFTINGKAFPSTAAIELKQGQRLRLRFIGAGQFVHPMHLHGPPFRIVATDGHPVPSAAQLTKDTVLVGPGERYDVEWTATEPGMWMLHCHIPHHTTNDHEEPGGLMLTVNVRP
ncbi:MAG TPA: copper oxidase [Chloroflexia bacterium]|nr:copper oxidase [Chloroflexia bacterium]